MDEVLLTATARYPGPARQASLPCLATSSSGPPRMTSACGDERSPHYNVRKSVAALERRRWDRISDLESFSDAGALNARGLLCSQEPTSSACPVMSARCQLRTQAQPQQIAFVIYHLVGEGEQPSAARFDAERVTLRMQPSARL